MVSHKMKLYMWSWSL